MNSFIWWMIIFLVTSILELSSPGFFYFISFAAGSLAAALISLAGFPLWVEFATFLLVSLASFVILTRYIKASSRDTLHQTNVYALLGKQGVVTDTIQPLKKGWVQVAGELWAAKAEQEITKGAIVQVVRVEGSHIVVKQINAEE